LEILKEKLIFRAIYYFKIKYKYNKERKIKQHLNATDSKNYQKNKRFADKKRDSCNNLNFTGKFIDLIFIFIKKDSLVNEIYLENAPNQLFL
jgi:hypothetical protein